ncbi:DUF6176 family protein [Streptosporangium soli]|nr:DUF6176 family protein [Streptosporangium sp. KLBMP 9127]
MVSKVKPDQADRLREWFGTVSGPRRDEFLTTLLQEGVRHEHVHLLHTSDGPLMIYAIEAEDTAQAITTFEQSAHQVDLDHREVLTAAFAGIVEPEVLLDFECG